MELCWRYVPKLAVKLPEILCCSSFNGVKLQNEIFHEPGTSPDQPLVPIHPIICHLAGSSPGKPAAVPRAMNYWQANSCASRWRRGDWIWRCNSQWDADGSTARGWTSWTGGNGWGDDDWSSGRRIDSDPMEKRIKRIKLSEERVSRIELSEERVSRIELLEERVSSLEKEVAALRQAGTGGSGFSRAESGLCTAAGTACV